MLYVDPAIGELFNSILEPIHYSRLFTPTLDSLRHCTRHLIRYSMISGIAQREDTQKYANRNYGRVATSLTKDFTLVKPQDEGFHLALACPYFSVDPYADDEVEQNPQPIVWRDALGIYEASKGKEGRKTYAHLMQMEAIKNAVWPGSFFAAVVPKKWLGQEMQFMQNWIESAADVAKIKLPSSAVQWVVPTDHPNVRHRQIWERGTVHLPCTGEWYLMIWMRPMEERREKVHDLLYAQYRHSVFQWKLESLGESSLKRCSDSFRHSEWYGSVKMWHKLLDKYPSHGKMGRNSTTATRLPDPEDVFFFELEKDQSVSPVVLEDDDLGKIKRLANAVVIRPGRKTRIELPPMPETGKPSFISQAAMHDVRVSFGFVDSQEYFDRYEFAIDHKMSKVHYSEYAEQLCSEVYQRGLIPYIRESDQRKLAKQKRSLAIQLAPVERTIPIKSVDSEGKETTSWETIYDDIGLNAVFPEVVDLWRHRAHKMRMQDATYDFQFEDIVYHACKDSLINGNHMGLGKTREMLMLCLLKGYKHNLIICPKKLVGEWQDEIYNVIVPYVRRIKRDWRGEFMTADINLIENVSDITPDRLAKFNIISYDKLKATPRDGRFYKCPKCKTIAYSFWQQPYLRCPGNPLQPEHLRCSHIVKQWKEKVESRNWEIAEWNEEHPEEKKNYLKKFPVEKSTGERIPWKAIKTMKRSEYRFQDTRVSEFGAKPEVTRMIPQENMYIKQKPYVKSTDTNEDGIQVKRYGYRERKPHISWMFANLLRNMFSNIIADEALYFANKASKRAQAVMHLNAKSKRPLTGTPMKGMPQQILPIWNWTFDRLAFPHYREYDPTGEQRFLKKYKTEVLKDCIVDEEGNVSGGTWKQVPKINNAELFQTEFAPYMRRHTRNEPEVIKDIPKKNIVYNDEKIGMSEEHRKYYQLWLEQFAEWWKEMKEDTEKRSANQGALLTKISYLINASTMPNYMYNNILKSKNTSQSAIEGKNWAARIGPYNGPLPAKLRRAFDITRDAVSEGDKVLIGSLRKVNLACGDMWAKKSGFNSMIIDGSVPLKVAKNTNRSLRHRKVQDFRNKGYNCMWAGLEALAEGMNIPEANHGIILDSNWRHDKPRQFIGRMIRPQQQKTIYQHFLMHEGTIDDFIAAVCYLKARSSDEGMDYMEFDDFSVAQIPDFAQYADSIVDGTEHIEKSKMWLAVEHFRKQIEKGEETDEYDKNG